MNRTLRLLSMVAVLGLMTGVSVYGQEFPNTVPDGGSTLALLGAALAGLGMIRRKLG